MNFRRMHYFVTIAECGNLHRAAERLHIAQPALSRQMNQLETEIGIQLLQRHPRGVEPTPFGWIFLAESKRILAQVSDLKERVRCATRNPAGKLRAGFDDSVAQNEVLAKASQIMRDRFPDVELALVAMSETQQIEALKAREIDIGFAYDICGEFMRHAEIDCHTIQNDDMVAVLRADHFLAGKKMLSLAELNGQNIVMITKEKAPKIGYQYLLKACEKGGLTLNVTQEVTSIDALFSLVSVGVGVSLVARHVRDTLPPALVLRPVSDLEVNLALTLMWRKNALSPATQHFVNIVQSLAAPVEPPLALAS